MLYVFPSTLTPCTSSMNADNKYVPSVLPPFERVTYADGMSTFSPSVPLTRGRSITFRSKPTPAVAGVCRWAQSASDQATSSCDSNRRCECRTAAEHPARPPSAPASPPAPQRRCRPGRASSDQSRPIPARECPAPTEPAPLLPTSSASRAITLVIASPASSRINPR